MGNDVAHVSIYIFGVAQVCSVSLDLDTETSEVCGLYRRCVGVETFNRYRYEAFKGIEREMFH